MSSDPATSAILPPPTERFTVLGWLQKNLFSTWYDALLTVVSLGVIYVIGGQFVTWLTSKADWEVVQVNMRLLMVGQYPQAELWRIWLCLDILALVVGLTWGAWVRGRTWLGIALLLAPAALAFAPGLGAISRGELLALDLIALVGYFLGRRGGLRLRQVMLGLWVLYFPLVILIVHGLSLGGEVFRVVPSNLWGGLLLTFLLTVVGITFSFPLGVLLALGRRSDLPVIRWASISYIEVIRGVPLVTILFMASTMVPLFLPGNVTIDRVLRAMVGIVLFSAAYVAENVRGGLQAIPPGQYEAAYSVGLNGWQTMTLIILPQALRIVIPPLVGQFISLFKDTSLVATIGLLELLGISRSVLAQPQYVGRQQEVLLFISLIYWVLCYFLSYVAQRLEIALSAGER
jgi:general L-amino acid transport system permease protein